LGGWSADCGCYVCDLGVLEVSGRGEAGSVAAGDAPLDDFS
jgi:hypothetical protein